MTDIYTPVAPSRDDFETVHSYLLRSGHTQKEEDLAAKLKEVYIRAVELSTTGIEIRDVEHE